MTRRPVPSQQGGDIIHDGEEQSPWSDGDDLEQLLACETRLRRDGSEALLLDDGLLFDEALLFDLPDEPEEPDAAFATLSVVRLGAA